MEHKAIGWRIIIRPDPVEEKTQSGIVLAVDKKIERNATTVGTIVDIGPDAFAAFKTSLPFAGLQIGDRVTYAKYSGKWVADENGEELLVVNDEDVVSKVC